ncbi:hypothetical protein DICPUDRAFT_148314 [Dictyostelium purpureum]|uniref:Uncharacterized protein n=1 Tax=Dictyostelium purpureum TaxID=5786 RepID=F0ZAT0_DICPU|nr:uncharacterized protein DICPUDRAFT_148314 [Dictyostelium purpureum]EGC38940.1 hypothetical protein DICPUDRAFT_148314 [Dictyostelium purpureum]|eukprot:XP_003284505.1 hypothetical protein DICPUDRAFT_148314 [Dictyostelium purpureum]
MVKQSITLKAETEEIENIYPCTDKVFFVKIKCSNCGETPDKFIGLDKSNIEVVGKSNVNLLMKCKGCNRENSIVVEETNYSERTIESEKSFEIARFDCRGVEIEEFDPRDAWIVVSSSGKKYNDVDLTE